MWPRLSIVAGLVTGIAAAALVIGGILFLGPGPTPVFSDPPPAGPPSPSATASAIVDRLADRLVGGVAVRLRRALPHR